MAISLQTINLFDIHAESRTAAAPIGPQQQCGEFGGQPSGINESISKPLRLVVAAVTLALVASIVPSTLIAAQSAATPDDVDGDGIPNLVDPDSDGDGVLDVDEFGPCGTGGNIVYNHNHSFVDNDWGGQGQFATFESGADAYVSNTTDLSFGPGIFENPDQGFYYAFGGADAPNFAGAQSSDDYVQVSLTPSTDLLLTGIDHGFFTDDSSFAINNFQIASTFATMSNFSDEVVLQQDVQVGVLSNNAFTFVPVPPVTEVLTAGT